MSDVDSLDADSAAAVPVSRSSGLFAMKRLRLLLALLLPVMLGGCPPGTVTLKTVTLSPSAVNNSSEQSWYVNSLCMAPPPFGTGPSAAAPAGQMYVGFQDVYFQGPAPFPCEWEDDLIFRGHVTFDLRQFDVIAGATLLFGLDSSGGSVASNGTVGGTPDNPAQSYATTVGMSTGTKDEGQGPYFWDFDNPVQLPACTTMMFTPCSLDVTTQVKAWLANTHPDYGLIVAGPVMDFPSNLPHDNNANISWYRGLQLQVVYDPSRNPRAPQ